MFGTVSQLAVNQRQLPGGVFQRRLRARSGRHTTLVSGVAPGAVSATSPDAFPQSMAPLQQRARLLCSSLDQPRVLEPKQQESTPMRKETPYADEKR